LARIKINNMKNKYLLMTFAIITIAMSSAAQNAEAYYRRAVELYSKQNYSAAIEYLTKAIKTDPEFVDAYLKRGEAKYIADDIKGAIADYTFTLQIDPKNKEAYKLRAIAKIEADDKKGAWDDYSKVVELDPKNEENIIRLVNYTLEYNMYDNLINFATNFIENNPENQYGYYIRGVAVFDKSILHKKNDFENAIIDFKKALQFEKNYSKVYWGSWEFLGEIYYRKGYLEEAMNCLNNTFQGGNESADANLLRGFIYFEDKNYKVAIEVFNETIKMIGNGGNSLAYIGLSISLYMEGQMEEAKKAIKSAFSDYAIIEMKMDGIKELENEGYFFTDNQKKYIKKVFDLINK
jgi:tetratricopeptide (TPR) repeat protein